MNPKLTIGMAVYDDFDGAYFTIQSLRLYHDLRDVELIVVDNKPDSAGSASIRHLLEQCQPGTAGARYVAASEVVGTSAPRNRVFAEAAGEAVLCVDSHVLLAPGSVERLLRWYETHPESRDLVSGPMLYDSLGNQSTHFVDFWRGEMWGIWGQAWEACAGGERFSVLDDGTGRAKFVSLEMGSVPLTSSAACDKAYPDLPYAGHEPALSALGFRPLGFSPDDEFEIPGMGLGLFSCRRSAWLEFNKDFRGFGGEEMYIHEKFRQAGARCWCVGFLKWVHRFGRPGGVKYPLTRWNKVRNYVLGHVELGRPLDEIREHFVTSGLMPQLEWDSLIEDPERLLPKVLAGAVSAPLRSVEAIYEAVRSTPRDLEKHFPKLRELAAKCPRITEFSKRRETIFALAAGSMASGGAERVISWCGESPHDLLPALVELAPGVAQVRGASTDIAEIKETDLLFLHSTHTRARLMEELGKFAPRVTRYIALGGTSGNGQRGEDGGPGLLEAMRDFVANHPEWFVCHHTAEQYGLTVLARLAEDRPAAKILPWPLGHGPGTELSGMLAMLGINPAPSCDCKGKANQMDAWGVEGCRERRDTIIQWMRDGQGRWGWKDKLAAATKAVTSGLALKLDLLDPFPSLIDEAIRRAKEKENAEV